MNQRTKYIVVNANEEADILKNGVYRTWMSAYFEDADTNHVDHIHIKNILSQVSDPSVNEYLLIRIDKQLKGEVFATRELGGYILMYQMPDVVLKPGEFTLVDRYEPKNSDQDAGFLEIK